VGARRAVVVGGGIGGLAAGAALARSGWQVVVCERAGSLEPVGAGISLWPNALRALDRLGGGDAVRARAAIGAGTGVRRPDGAWLGRSDVAVAVRARFGDPLVVLARSELVDLLAALVPPGSLRLGAAAETVEPGDPLDPDAPARVVLVGGERLAADLVVGADGAWSATRAAVLPGAPGPVYAGYTTWRFLAPVPAPVVGSETWGPRGQRFAVVPMAGGRVDCYATATGPPGVRAPDEAEELRARFGSWHAPIPGLLAGLRPGQVLHHDVQELPALPALHRGRVALLGDAAHAMTPELGQGGCLALEDAVTLAALTAHVGASGPGLAAALAGYSAERLPRTTAVARRSRSVARLTQATGPVGTRLRDLSGRLVGRVPPALVVRGLAPVVDWRPPAGEPPTDPTNLPASG
jgi:2-polyprenyl-6-methoxyphenol hydroxylase-like FAD-dependent oxidoreductase